MWNGYWVCSNLASAGEPPPASHDHFIHCFTAQPLTVWRCVCERRQRVWPGCTASSQCLMDQCSALLSQWRHQLSAMTMKSASASGPDCALMSHTRGDADRIRHVLTSEPTRTRRTSNTTLMLYSLKHLTQFIHFFQGTVCSVTIFLTIYVHWGSLYLLSILHDVSGTSRDLHRSAAAAATTTTTTNKQTATTSTIFGLV